MTDTRVTFPSGAVEGRARVLDVVDLGGGRCGVVVDQTPFHPVDHTWPDQPADSGTLAGLPVLDCLVGASPAIDEADADPRHRWVVAGDIPARRGDPALTWGVVHVLDAEAADRAGISRGSEVELVVDGDRRRRLSRGHSACHLAALALNRAAAPLWSKDVGRRDGLGSPDLDSLAIVVSRIEPDAALDEYRLGKSLRKRGLATTDLLEHLPQLQDEANALLSAWTAAGGHAVVDTGGDDRLVARRTWRADLPGGQASIPCGGTHVTDIADVAGTRVVYEPTDGGFRVLTTVPPEV